MKPYKAFLARLGLGSARGRYLYIAGLFSLFLLITSWLEQSWLLALIGLSIVVLGFFVFEYTIRLPIVRTTKALKAEMQSSKGAALPKTNIVEIDHLLEAFNQMRRQVHMRLQHLEVLLDGALAAVLTIDQDGRIETHNSTAGDIFGCTVSELNGASINEFVPDVFHGGNLNPIYEDETRHETRGLCKKRGAFIASVLVRKAALDDKLIHIVRVRDIDDRRKMENELKSREQHLQILLDSTKAGFLTIDQNGLIRTFNTHAAHILGYEGPDLINLPIDQLLSRVFSKGQDKDGAVYPILDSLYIDGEIHETKMVSKNKAEFPATVMVRKTVLDGKPGHIIRVRDITDKKATEAKLNSRQQRLETILQNAAEGILTFDQHGVIESFNNAAEKLFGYKEQEIMGQPINLLIPAEARDAREGYVEHFMRAEIKRLIGHETEVTGRHKDGTKFPIALKISALMLEGKQLYTGLVADISERKALIEHLKSMAEHDGLTGLYNRGYFQSELERVVERARRAGDQNYALLYIDLDNFKYVNDTLGHAAGDRVLIEVAAILNKRARKSDLIARLGGDEFAVLLYNTTPELATQVAESFREQMMNYTLKQDGQRVDIGCSIGVSLITSATKSAAESMSQADIACHFAKREGRNRVHLFKPADEAGFVSMSLDMGWSRRIREAIKDDRFVLACQPIIHTQTGRVESYEVLIRLLDDNDELIMPGGFLPAAERFGLSADIDKWVIVHAIDALAERHEQMPSLRYSINLSGQTLSDLSVTDLIAAKLKTAGLDPSALIFEVTETAAIADMAVAETFLSRLQEIGCKTALDDFGSGFSSFAYLKDLPVDSVKIDGRFVKNLANSSVDQAMVKAMNDIAHALGKETVAEFVENEESMVLLREYGVDSAQGYHLGRPDMMRPYKTEVDLGKKPKQRKRM